jgi:hypothetical protein
MMKKSILPPQQTLNEKQTHNLTNRNYSVLSKVIWIIRDGKINRGAANVDNNSLDSTAYENEKKLFRK